MEEEDVVMVSSDSDDESVSWNQKSKNIQFRLLWEKARPILLHHVLRGRKSPFFPYEQFKELAGDLRKYLPQVNVASTRAFIWKNLLRWLVSMKLCYEGTSDLQYDERYTLILTDFMAQYINYKCNIFTPTTDETELCQRVDEILQTLGIILNGNMPGILMTLLKIDIKDEYKPILDPIFRKYLSRKCFHKTNDLISYLRLILCYRQWKRLYHYKEEKELINEIAVGLSEKALRTRPPSDDLPRLNPVLPKELPRITHENRRFAVISGLIGFALKNKSFGTRILLVNKSLDLEDTIERFFQQYEYHISESDALLCETARALRIDEDVSERSKSRLTTVPRPMLLSDTKGSEARKKSISNEKCQIELSSSDEEIEEKNKHEIKRNPEAVDKDNIQGTKAGSQHLSMDCDIFSISNSLSQSSLSFNGRETLSLSFKQKSESRLSSSNNQLSVLQQNNKDVISLDTTDDEDDRGGDKDMTQAGLYEQQIDSSPVSAPSLLIEKLQQRAISAGKSSNLTRSSNLNTLNSDETSGIRSTRRQTDSIVLLSSSDDDDDDCILFLTPPRSANSGSISSVRQEEPPVNSADVNLRVEKPLRKVSSNEICRSSRKEKSRCITGEVSSTTLLDCSNAADLNCSVAQTVEPLENARVVGTLSAVCTTPRRDSPTLNLDNSYISDDDQDDVSSNKPVGGSHVSRYFSSKFSKVVEEATSSTSEIPARAGSESLSDNVIFSIRTYRSRRSTSSSPCPTRANSPMESCAHISPSSSVRTNSKAATVDTLSLPITSGRITIRRLNSLIGVSAEDEVPTCSRYITGQVSAATEFSGDRIKQSSTVHRQQAVCFRQSTWSDSRRIEDDSAKKKFKDVETFDKRSSVVPRHIARVAPTKRLESEQAANSVTSATVAKTTESLTVETVKDREKLCENASVVRVESANQSITQDKSIFSVNENVADLPLDSVLTAPNHQNPQTPELPKQHLEKYLEVVNDNDLMEFLHDISNHIGETEAEAVFAKCDGQGEPVGTEEVSSKAVKKIVEKENDVTAIDHEISMEDSIVAEPQFNENKKKSKSDGNSDSYFEDIPLNYFKYLTTERDMSNEEDIESPAYEPIVPSPSPMSGKEITELQVKQSVIDTTPNKEHLAVDKTSNYLLSQDNELQKAPADNLAADKAQIVVISEAKDKKEEQVIQTSLDVVVKQNENEIEKESTQHLEVCKSVAYVDLVKVVPVRKENMQEPVITEASLESSDDKIAEDVVQPGEAAKGSKFDNEREQSTEELDVTEMSEATKSTVVTVEIQEMANDRTASDLNSHNDLTGMTLDSKIKTIDEIMEKVTVTDQELDTSLPVVAERENEKEVTNINETQKSNEDKVDVDNTQIEDNNEENAERISEIVNVAVSESTFTRESIGDISKVQMDSSRAQKTEHNDLTDMILDSKIKTIDEIMKKVTVTDQELDTSLPEVAEWESEKEVTDINETQKSNEDKVDVDNTQIGGNNEENAERIREIVNVAVSEPTCTRESIDDISKLQIDSSRDQKTANKGEIPIENLKSQISCHSNDIETNIEEFQNIDMALDVSDDQIFNAYITEDEGEEAYFSDAIVTKMVSVDKKVSETEDETGLTDNQIPQETYTTEDNGSKTGDFIPSVNDQRDITNQRTIVEALGVENDSNDQHHKEIDVEAKTTNKIETKPFNRLRINKLKIRIAFLWVGIMKVLAKKRMQKKEKSIDEKKVCVAEEFSATEEPTPSGDIRKEHVKPIVETAAHVGNEVEECLTNLKPMLTAVVKKEDNKGKEVALISQTPTRSQTVASILMATNLAQVIRLEVLTPPTDSLTVISRNEMPFASTNLGLTEFDLKKNHVECVSASISAVFAEINSPLSTPVSTNDTSMQVAVSVVMSNQPHKNEMGEQEKDSLCKHAPIQIEEETPSLDTVESTNEKVVESSIVTELALNESEQHEVENDKNVGTRSQSKIANCSNGQNSELLAGTSSSPELDVQSDTKTFSAEQAFELLLNEHASSKEKTPNTDKVALESAPRAQLKLTEKSFPSDVSIYQSTSVEKDKKVKMQLILAKDGPEKCSLHFHGENSAVETQVQGSWSNELFQNLRRAEEVFSEEDSNLSTKVQISSDDLGDSSLSFDLEVGDSFSTIQESKSVNDATGQKATSICAEDQEVSEIIAKEPFTYNTYSEDCGTPVLDEKDIEDIESPSCKVVSLSILKEIPKLPETSAIIPTVTLSPDQVVLNQTTPKTVPKTYTELCTSSPTLLKVLDKIPDTPSRNDVTPQSSTNTQFVEPSPKPRPINETDSEYQKTPLKMRLKRRISQCTDINEEFNLGPSESIKPVDTYKLLTLASKNNESRSSSAVNLLTKDPMHLAIRSTSLTLSKNTITDAIKNSISPSLDEEDQNLRYQESWLKKIGILKTSNKTPTKGPPSPITSTSYFKSPLMNLEETTIKQQELLENSSEPISSIYKNEGRRRKPRRVKKFTEQPENKVPNLKINKVLTSPVVMPLPLLNACQSTSKFPLPGISPTKTIVEQSYNPEDIKAATILSDMLKKSTKVEGLANIKIEKVRPQSPSPRGSKRKPWKQIPARFMRLTRSMSHLIDQASSSETASTPSQSSSKTDVTKASSSGRSHAQSSDSIWQQNNTREILHSANVANEIASVNGMLSLYASTTNLSSVSPSDSDDDGKLVIDLGVAACKTLTKTSVRKTKKQKKINSNKKSSLENKVNELIHKVTTNSQTPTIASPSDRVYQLTPEVDVIFGNNPKTDNSVPFPAPNWKSSDEEVAQFYPIIQLTEDSSFYTPKSTKRGYRKQKSVRDRSCITSRRILDQTPIENEKFKNSSVIQHSDVISLSKSLRGRPKKRSKASLFRNKFTNEIPLKESVVITASDEFTSGLEQINKRLNFSIDSILGTQSMSPKTPSEKEAEQSPQNESLLSPSLSSQISMNKEMWMTTLSLRKNNKSLDEVVRKISADSSNVKEKFVTSTPLKSSETVEILSPTKSPGREKKRRKLMVTMKRELNKCQKEENTPMKDDQLILSWDRRSSRNSIKSLDLDIYSNFESPKYEKEMLMEGVINPAEWTCAIKRISRTKSASPSKHISSTKADSPTKTDSPTKADSSTKADSLIKAGNLTKTDSPTNITSLTKAIIPTKATSLTKTVSLTKSDSPIKVDSLIKADSLTEAGTLIKADIQTKITSLTKAITPTKATSLTKTDSLTKVDSPTKTDSPPKADSLIKADHLTKADSPTKITSLTKAITPMNATSLTKADSQTKTNSQVKPDNRTKSDSPTKAGSLTEADSLIKADSLTKTTGSTMAITPTKVKNLTDANSPTNPINPTKPDKIRPGRDEASPSRSSKMTVIREKAIKKQPDAPCFAKSKNVDVKTNSKALETKATRKEYESTAPSQSGAKKIKSKSKDLISRERKASDPSTIDSKTLRPESLKIESKGLTQTGFKRAKSKSKEPVMPEFNAQKPLFSEPDSLRSERTSIKVSESKPFNSKSKSKSKEPVTVESNTSESLSIKSKVLKSEVILSRVSESKSIDSVPKTEVKALASSDSKRSKSKSREPVISKSNTLDVMPAKTKASEEVLSKVRESKTKTDVSSQPQSKKSKSKSKESAIAVPVPVELKVLNTEDKPTKTGYSKSGVSVKTDSKKANSNEPVTAETLKSKMYESKINSSKAVKSIKVNLMSKAEANLVVITADSFKLKPEEHITPESNALENPRIETKKYNSGTNSESDLTTQSETTIESKISKTNLSSSTEGRRRTSSEKSKRGKRSSNEVLNKLDISVSKRNRTRGKNYEHCLEKSIISSNLGESSETPWIKDSTDIQSNLKSETEGKLNNLPKEEDSSAEVSKIQDVDIKEQLNTTAMDSIKKPDDVITLTHSENRKIVTMSPKEMTLKSPTEINSTDEMVFKPNDVSYSQDQQGKVDEIKHPISLSRLDDSQTQEQSDNVVEIMSSSPPSKAEVAGKIPKPNDTLEDVEMVDLSETKITEQVTKTTTDSVGFEPKSKEIPQTEIKVPEGIEKCETGVADINTMADQLDTFDKNVEQINNPEVVTDNVEVIKDNEDAVEVVMKPVEKNMCSADNQEVSESSIKTEVVTTSSSTVTDKKISPLKTNKELQLLRDKINKEQKSSKAKLKIIANDDGKEEKEERPPANKDEINKEQNGSKAELEVTANEEAKAEKQLSPPASKDEANKEQEGSKAEVDMTASEEKKISSPVNKGETNKKPKGSKAELEQTPKEEKEMCPPARDETNKEQKGSKAELEQTAKEEKEICPPAKKDVKNKEQKGSKAELKVTATEEKEIRPPVNKGEINKEQGGSKAELEIIANEEAKAEKQLPPPANKDDTNKEQEGSKAEVEMTANDETKKGKEICPPANKEETIKERKGSKSEPEITAKAEKKTCAPVNKDETNKEQKGSKPERQQSPRIHKYETNKEQKGSEAELEITAKKEKEISPPANKDKINKEQKGSKAELKITSKAEKEICPPVNKYETNKGQKGSKAELEKTEKEEKEICPPANKDEKNKEQKDSKAGLEITARKGKVIRPPVNKDEINNEHDGLKAELEIKANEEVKATKQLLLPANKDETNKEQECSKAEVEMTANDETKKEKEVCSPAHKEKTIKERKGSQSELEITAKSEKEICPPVNKDETNKDQKVSKAELDITANDEAKELMLAEIVVTEVVMSEERPHTLETNKNCELQTPEEIGENPKTTIGGLELKIPFEDAKIEEKSETKFKSNNRQENGFIEKEVSTSSLTTEQQDKVLFNNQDMIIEKPKCPLPIDTEIAEGLFSENTNIKETEVDISTRRSSCDKITPTIEHNDEPITEEQTVVKQLNMAANVTEIPETEDLYKESSQCATLAQTFTQPTVNDPITEGKITPKVAMVENREIVSQLVDRLEPSIESTSKHTVSDLRLDTILVEPENLFTNTIDPAEGIDAAERIDVANVIYAAKKIDSVEGIDDADRKEDAEGIDVAKGIDSVEGIDAAKAIDAAKTIDSVEGIDDAGRKEDAGGIDVAKGIDSVEGIDSSEKIDAAKKIDVGKEIDSDEEIDATKRVCATKGIDVIKGIDDTKGIDAAKAVDATKGTDATKGAFATRGIGVTEGTIATKPINATKGLDANKGIDATKAIDSAKGIDSDNEIDSAKRIDDNKRIVAAQSTDISNIPKTAQKSKNLTKDIKVDETILAVPPTDIEKVSKKFGTSTTSKRQLHSFRQSILNTMARRKVIVQLKKLKLNFAKIQINPSQKNSQSVVRLKERQFSEQADTTLAQPKRKRTSLDSERNPEVSQITSNARKSTTSATVADSKLLEQIEALSRASVVQKITSEQVSTTRKDKGTSLLVTPSKSVKSKDEVQKVAEQLEESIKNILGNKISEHSHQNSSETMSKILTANRPQGFDSVPDDIFAGNGDTSDNIESKFLPSILKPEDLIIETDSTSETDNESQDSSKETKQSPSTDQNNMKPKNDESEQSTGLVNTSNSENNPAPDLEMDPFAITNIPDINAIGNSLIFEESCIPDIMGQSDFLVNVLDEINEDLVPCHQSDCLIGNYGQKFDNGEPFYFFEPPLLFLEPEIEAMTTVNPFDIQRKKPFETDLFSYSDLISLQAGENLFTDNSKNNKVDSSGENMLDPSSKDKAVFKKPNYVSNTASQVGFGSYDGLLANSSRYCQPSNSAKRIKLCNGNEIEPNTPTTPSAVVTPTCPELQTNSEIIVPITNCNTDFPLPQDTNNLPPPPDGQNPVQRKQEEDSTPENMSNEQAQNTINFYTPPVEISTEVGFESYDELIASNNYFQSTDLDVNKQPIQPEKETPIVVAKESEPFEVEKVNQAKSKPKVDNESVKTASDKEVKKSQKEVSKDSETNSKLVFDKVKAKLLAQTTPPPKAQGNNSPLKLKSHPTPFWKRKSNNSKSSIQTPSQEKSEPEVVSPTPSLEKSEDSSAKKEKAEPSLSAASEPAIKAPSTSVSEGVNEGVKIDLAKKEDLQNLNESESESKANEKKSSEVNDNSNRKRQIKIIAPLEDLPEKKARVENLSTDDLVPEKKRPIEDTAPLEKPSKEKNQATDRLSIDSPLDPDRKGQVEDTVPLEAQSEKKIQGAKRLKEDLFESEKKQPLENIAPLEEPPEKKTRLSKHPADDLFDRLKRESPINPLTQKSKTSLLKAPSSKADDNSPRESVTDVLAVPASPIEVTKVTSNPSKIRRSSKSSESSSSHSNQLKTESTLCSSSNKRSQINTDAKITQKSLVKSSNPIQTGESSSRKSETPILKSSKLDSIPKQSAMTPPSPLTSSNKPLAKTPSPRVTFSPLVTNIPEVKILNSRRNSSMEHTNSDSSSQSQKPIKSILVSSSKSKTHSGLPYQLSKPILDPPKLSTALLNTSPPPPQSLKFSKLKSSSSFDSGTNSPSHNQKSLNSVQESTKHSNFKSESNSYEIRFHKSLSSHKSSAGSSSTSLSKSDVSSPFDNSKSFSSRSVRSTDQHRNSPNTPDHRTPTTFPEPSNSKSSASNDYPIMLGALTNEIDKLSKALEELPEVGKTYREHKNRMRLLELHKQKLKQLEELKRRYEALTSSTVASSSAKPRAYSERRPIDNHHHYNSNRSMVPGSQRELKDRHRDRRHGYVNKFGELDRKTFEFVDVAEPVVNVSQRPKVLPSWDPKPASTEEIIADLKMKKFWAKD